MLRRLWVVGKTYLLWLCTPSGLWLCGFVLFFSYFNIILPLTKNAGYSLQSTLPHPVDRETGKLVEIVRTIWRNEELVPAVLETIIPTSTQALSLRTDSGETIDSLQALERLTQLRYLDLSSCEFSAQFRSLPDLPFLETLILPASMSESENVLQQLSRFSQLTTLGIDPWKGSEPTSEDLSRMGEKLGSLQNLQTVYWGTNHGSTRLNHYYSELQRIILLRQELKSKAVLHSSQLVRSTNHLATFPMFYGMFIALCVMMAIKRSCGTTGRLVPHFPQPHLLFLAFGAGLIFLCTLWLMYQEAYQLSALLCYLFVMVIPLSILLWFLPRYVEVFGWFPLFPVLYWIISFFFPQEVEIFLLGGYPFLNLALWGGIGVCLVVFPMIYRRTIRYICSHDYGDVLPVSKESHKLFLSRLKTDRKTSRHETDGDHQLLKRLKSYHERSGLWRKSQLWRCANPGKRMSRIIMVVVGIIVLIIFANRPTEQGGFIVKSPIHTMVYASYVIMGMLVIYWHGAYKIWIGRVKAMSQAALLPISRNDFRKVCLLGMGWDSLVIAIFCLSYVVILFYIAVPIPLLSFRFMSVMGFAISLCVLLSAVSFYCFLYSEFYTKHQFIFTITFGVSLMGLMFFVYTFLGGFSLIPIEGHFPDDRLIYAGLFLLFVSTGILSFLWSEFSRKEWGLV